MPPPKSQVLFVVYGFKLLTVCMCFWGLSHSFRGENSSES